MLIRLLICSTLIKCIWAISGECVSLKDNALYEKCELVYEWNYINFTWPTPAAYEQAVSSGKYVPEHNIIAGIKYYNEKLFLSLPRAKPGSPVTLAYVSSYPDNNIHQNPLLVPYPSWKMNNESSCSNLINVQSMEIDRKGIMWVLDGRRIDEGRPKCPPKIVLLDLQSRGRIIRSYNVPEEVCKKDSCFMNDIVLDEYDGGYAYISDTSSDPGIIVYSRKLNKAWKVRDKTMFAQAEALNFTVHGVVHNHLTPIDGIALSPPTSLDDHNRMVYYTALTGYSFYGLNTTVLRHEKLAKSSKVSQYIIDYGKKEGPADGLMMDSEGDLYFGLLTMDAVAKWNVNKPISTAQIIDRNETTLFWPDTFGYDPFGNLYLTANKIDYFLHNDIKKEDINFRVLKLYTGTCSYQY